MQVVFEKLSKNVSDRRPHSPQNLREHLLAGGRHEMLEFGNVLGEFSRRHVYVSLWGAARLRYLCVQARMGRKHKQRENKGTPAHVAVDQGSPPGGSLKVASNIHPG